MFFPLFFLSLLVVYFIFRTLSPYHDCCGFHAPVPVCDEYCFCLLFENVFDCTVTIWIVGVWSPTLWRGEPEDHRKQEWWDQQPEKKKRVVDAPEHCALDDIF